MASEKFTNIQLIKSYLDFELQTRLIMDSDSQKVDWEYASRRYAASIFGFVSEIKMDFNFAQPLPFADEPFIEFFQEFERYVTLFNARMAARLAIKRDLLNSPSNEAVLALSFDYKHQIHDRIYQIRKIVEVMELSTDKKDNIFKKIAILALEIDKERTSLGTALVTIVDISNAAGKAAKNLAPFTKKMESLYKILASAKEEDDQLQIEQDDVKKLPAPVDD